VSKNKKSKTKTKVPRNSNALSAKSRVAGMVPMKSRNAPRGGNRNEQRELLEEAEEEIDIEKIKNAPGFLSSLTDEQKEKVFSSDAGDTGGGIDDDWDDDWDEEDETLETEELELEELKVLNAFDKYLEEQMKSPDFKRAYEETIKQLKKKP
jgi:hypothetical protein